MSDIDLQVLYMNELVTPKFTFEMLIEVTIGPSSSAFQGIARVVTIVIG